MDRGEESLGSKLGRIGLGRKSEKYENIFREISKYFYRNMEMF